MGASLSHLILHPLLEHFVHSQGDLLQHLIPDVGVDVGGGLEFCVADDLHSHQRVNAILIGYRIMVVQPLVSLTGRARDRANVVLTWGKIRYLPIMVPRSEER